MSAHKIKGKYNRLKIGQKVRAKKELIDWHASHLCWSYSRLMNGTDGYMDGDREIEVADLPKVYVWSFAKLSKKIPTGVVKHYGAGDNDDGVDRKNVWVEFTFKTELGAIPYGTYVSEKDVTLNKKRKK